MKFDLAEVIGIIAITQSLLLALFLITHNKGNKQSNKILAILLFIYAIYIPSSLITQKHISISYIIIAYICSQCSLLIGPFIYFYFISIINKNFHLSRKSIIHFVPFAIISGYLIYSFYVLHTSPNIWIFSERNVGIIFLLQSFVYLTLSYKKLKLYRNINKPVDDKIQKPIANWLKLLLIVFITVWIINTHMFVILDLWEQLSLLPILIIVSYFVIFIILNLIVFFSLKNSAIFTVIGKYKNSSLSILDKQDIKKKLLLFMENEKLYLNPLLTLSHLSKKLLINRGHLSQIINEAFHQHYNDFINSYRIQESMQIMKDPSNNKMNMLEIAYKVGFNSKSVFNRAFRKHTGQAPMEFRKYCYSHQ